MSPKTPGSHGRQALNKYDELARFFDVIIYAVEAAVATFLLSIMMNASSAGSVSGFIDAK